MGQGASPLWAAVVLLVLLGAALAAGLLTGAIRLDAQRLRRSGRRAAVGLDATFSPRDRQDALNFLLDDQHRVVLEQERGDGDPDGSHESVLYEYPDGVNCDPTEAV